LEKGKLKGIFVSGNMPAGTEYKDVLQDVLHSFPYFQLAQVLYAKQLYDANEPEASGRIKLATVYAPDRKAMYHLFKKTAENTDEIKPYKVDTDRAKPREKEEVKYNFVYSSATSANKGPISDPVKKGNETASLSESFIRKELETKPLDSSPTKQQPKVIEPAIAPAKKPYIKPIIEKKRSLYTRKAELPVTKPLVVPKPLVIETLPKIEEKKPENSDVLTEKADIAVKPEVAPVEEKKQEMETIPPVVPEVEEPKIIIEPFAESNLKYSFNAWLKVIPEISLERKQEIKPFSLNEASGIIERFLKDAPSVSRPKAQFFSPVKAAKMSITEDDTIVSETLAKIFLSQGSLNKALKAYQTLLLQFPEKKNIFAPRIEEIEALIRENTKPRTK
jgi:hypothetical protein